MSSLIVAGNLLNLGSGTCSILSIRASSDSTKGSRNAVCNVQSRKGNSLDSEILGKGLRGTYSYRKFYVSGIGGRVCGTNLRSRAFRILAAIGEDPEWRDDDYIALGLAHCFVKRDGAKVQDMFVIEAIPAGGLECMENGGTTCYTHVWSTNLGVALKQDASLLPEMFSKGTFCEDFDFRAKCASRTWKRDHPKEHLMNLVPAGTVRSDWNFSLEDKRILNMERVVNDEDNIKQDISIDVYGRTPKEDEMTAEIQSLYNV